VPKPLVAAIKEFFSSQLSQFDQTNPLAELTTNADFLRLARWINEGTRWICCTRYSPFIIMAICPIETPEGPECG